MGRSGFAIALERELFAAPLSKLREVVLELLYDQWNELLDERGAEEAHSWVSAGESSLLAIGDSDADENVPVDELMFWFYSADWPRERAEHYLNGALFIGRDDLTDKLKAIGYRIIDPHYPTKQSLAEEHDELVGPDTRAECPICRPFNDREKYGELRPVPVVPPPTDRRRELEKLRVQIHHADVIAANVSMWQDRAGSYSSPEEHSEMEADLAQATRDRAVAKTAIDALFARTRAEAPAEIESWALAHEAILCLYLNQCAESGESDGMAAYSAQKDLVAWAELRAGKVSWVNEQLSSTSLGRDWYRSLFGIDPHTLERV
jgi:hypothetical protein